MSAPLTPSVAKGYLPFALFLIVFSLSLFAWSGTLHTSDGLAMYAVSDSLVRQGTWDIENIRWMGLQQGTFGPDGLLYSRKGLAVSIIALPLVFVGYHSGNMGPVHAATLLTPILHALTAVYLYRTVRLLMPGSGERTAILVAGLWAFASMAFAYVKTWFSEPAVALAGIAALYHLLLWREHRSMRSVLAVGAWLGFSLLTRSANAIVFPIYGLALLTTLIPGGIGTPQPQGGSTGSFHPPGVFRALRPAFPVIALFLTPIVISGLIYLCYNALRFGNPFDSGYIAGEEFSAIWWQGIWGQTFSPGRGLVWYTPWIVLAIVGAWQWRRTAPMVVWLSWGSALIYILFYGKWYLWSGGFAWGPRFLVPILPLLALMTAPVLEMGKRWRGAWWALAITGFAINLIGVLYDFNLYQAWLDGQGLPMFAWETFANPAYAQIPTLLALGLQDFDNLDLAWVVNGSVEMSLALLQTLVFVVAAGCGLGWLIYKRKSGWVAQVAASGITVLLVGWWLSQLYGAEQSEAFQLPPSLTGQSVLYPEPDAQLWYDDPAIAPVVLNQVKGGWRITGFFVDGASLDADTEQRATDLAAQATAPIILISDGPDRAAHGLDRLLATHAYWVADTLLHQRELQTLPTLPTTAYRLTEYWQGPLSEEIPYEIDFAFVDGSSITLNTARVTPTVQNPNVLALLLTWEARTPLPATSQVFVQLTTADGTPVAQQDGSLAQGILDVSTLTDGQVVVDRHAFKVEPPLNGNGIAPGIYTLRFGLYRYDTLERAAISTGGNEITIPIEITE